MVNMNPDLLSLRPYVTGRAQQLQTEDPDHMKQLIELFQAEHGPTRGLSEALATSDGVAWWLHHCAEWRLEKLRALKRSSKGPRRSQEAP